MLANEMSALRHHMRDQGVIFCFSGYLTEDVLGGIGSALRQKLQLEETDRKTAKGLFLIFVELVQNVIRYSAEVEPLDPAPGKLDLRYGVLTIGCWEDRYFISCGNLIDRGDMARLTDSLGRLQAMDRPDLIKALKTNLKTGSVGGGKGAGVGFIEVARWASGGFEYDFREETENRVFFCLKAYV